MSRTADRVMWMLIGASIGAGIALLYAPRTGKDTRRFLRKKAESTRDAIADAGQSVIDGGREVYDSVVGAGRDAYDAVVGAGREVYRKGATAATGAAGIFDRGRRVVRENV